MLFDTLVIVLTGDGFTSGSWGLSSLISGRVGLLIVISPIYLLNFIKIKVKFQK